jgi:2'-5' RNA ligase
MRLFIAILFDVEMMDLLYDIELRLKSYAQGSFTHKENLHLTVNFIGETNRLNEAKDAMNQAVSKVKAEQFWLTIGGFGRFKRNEGDIYWVGVEREDTLWKLQKQLVKELKEEGFFDIDDREYKPHLTLGRRMKVMEHFDVNEFETGITPRKQLVNRISLMKSERQQGKLVYTEIYHVNFSNNH